MAARQYGAGKAERRAAVEGAVQGYLHAMADLAPRGSLDTWYRSTRANDPEFAGIVIDPASQAIVARAVEKARRRNNRSLLDHVGERRVDGGWRFREDPPILTRVDEATRERRFMLGRYHVVDVAHRVVGVGSVGTRAYVALLCGNSDQDALFLQVKEAVRPALDGYVTGMPDPYAAHEGEHVIYGQRLLQGVGDPLLGWTSIDGRPFYVRQMKNMKGEIPVNCLTGRPLQVFSYGYGTLLARAHARTGDAAAISGYGGGGHNRDLSHALAQWAELYADRNEADHAALLEAISAGRVEAAENAYL